MDTGLDLSKVPAFSTGQPDNDNSKPSPIIGGLAAGFHQLLGFGGSAIQGLGALTGVQPVADYGASVAANQAATAARVGRPDLDIAPWEQGGASTIPYLEYQASKMLPTLAGYGVASAVAPETTAGAALARVLPSFLGGVGAEATPAAVKAAAKFALGAGIFGGVTGFGQGIQSAAAKPGGVTAGDAAQALAEAPLYSAAGVLEPGFLRNAFGQAAEGKLATRVIARSISGGAVGAVQSGTMAALDQTFRPDISPQDKMSNIVDAAVSGAAVGGVFGGATGIRALKRANPADLVNNTDALNQAVDQALDLGQAGQNIGRVALPPPATFVDSAGRAAQGSQGAADLQATPREPQPSPDIPQAAPALFGPGGVTDRSAVPGSTMVVGRRGEAGRFTNEATGVEQPPIVPEDTSRAFRNFTDEELASAGNALANKAETDGRLAPQMQQIAKGIADELAIRRNESLTQPTVSEPQAEAVSANSSRGTESQAAPASVTDVKSYIADAMQGLKLPASLKDDLSKAKSVEDVQDIVHQESIIDAKGGKNRDLLAQRLGVLDNDSRPTPLADEISARKTPDGEQAPSPMFMASWKDEVNQVGQKDPIVRSLNPVNEGDAQLKLYRALGGDNVSDAVEKLAQDHGVLDDQKRLTPLAVDLAQRDPIEAADARSAAKSQDFKGKDVATFNQGVQDYVAGKDTPTKSDAYQAGVAFAQETNSVPKGALEKYNAREVTNADVANVEGTAPPPETRTIPADVRQGQLINEAIDNAGLHPTKDESDIAALKGMVRSGDYEGAMEGLRAVQRGEPLIGIDLRPEREFQPARIDQTSRDLGQLRGQAQAEVGRQQDLAGQQKTATKAEAERAIRSYELGKMIDAAHAEGEISGPDRLRLVNRLMNGRFGEVIKAVGEPTGKIGGRIAQAASRAQRRADLHTALQESLAQSAREAEVPELNVDKNGIIKPSKLAYTDSGAEERHQAAQVISHVVDHPDDAKGMMQQIANQGGELGAVAARMAKFVPDDLQVRVRLPQEMNALESEANTITGHPDAPVSGRLWGLYSSDASGLNRVDLHIGMPSPAVALHEVMHALTSRHLAAGTPIGREITSIYNRFKDQLNDKQDYAGIDAHEFIAEFMARQEVRDYVKSFGDGKGSIFQRAWDTIRKMIGMPPRDYVERMFQLAEAAGRQPLDGQGRPIRSRVMAAPAESNDTLENHLTDLSKVVGNLVDRVNLKGKLLGAQLYLADKHHIAEMFAKWFARPDGSNPLRDAELLERQRESVTARLTQLITNSVDRYNKLVNEKSAHAESIPRIMTSTEFPFDVTKAWSNQSKEVQAMTGLKDLHESYHNLWRGISPEAKEVLGDFRANNDIDFLRYHSLMLHAETVADVEASQALGADIMHTPVDEYLAQKETFNPTSARAWWLAKVNDQITALTSHMNSTMYGKDQPTTALLAKQYKGITETIKETQDAIAKINDKPYFHLPRFGQFFVDWKVKDQESLAKIADALEEQGYKGIISKDTDHNHVFMRLENLAQQKNLAELVNGFKEGGDVTHLAVGQLSDERYSSALLTRSANRLIESIQNNPRLDDEAKKAAAANLRRTILDLMPDNSINRVMSRRANVPGYDPDMIRGYAQRGKIGVDSASNTVVTPKIAQAYSEMRGMVKDASNAPLDGPAAIDVDQRNGMQRVVDELSRRNREMSEWGHNKYLDLLSRITSSHYLGLSPAFGFVQLSQLGVVTLPELGAKYGYVRSAQEMAKATATAFKVMQGVAAAGKEVSLTRAMDAVVTRDALVKAGLSERLTDFMMNIVGSGHVDLGGQIRELVRAAEATDKQSFDTAMRYATSIGYYSETMSRVIAAIATHNLEGPDKPVNEVADKARYILDESLFNFSPTNWGRAFGKKGILGAATPLATKFMQYQAQLTGKLYREVHNFIGGDAEAGRFLAGHLATMTVLAGALGLPTVTALAAAYDSVKDHLFSDGQPSDVRASFRNYMADTFGKGVGEVLSRGASRGAGFDVSQRLGEQDIIPFSRFFADRRTMKDSITDLESRSWGAPTSMIASYAKGIERISNGDFLGGAIAALPLGFSNPLKAYRMTTQGYVDSNGNKIPMTPTTAAVVAQALGFSPAPMAEYNEAKSSQTTRSQILQRQATQMRGAIADALGPGGDRSQARDLIAEAMKFDKANPAYAVLPGVEGAIMRRQQAAALSQRFQVPTGLNPKDIAARSFTRYADVDYHAQ